MNADTKEKRKQNTSSSSGVGLPLCGLITFFIVMSIMSYNANGAGSENRSAKSTKIDELIRSIGFYPMDESKDNSDNSVESDNYTTDQKLSPNSGIIMGPSGKETFYNLDMSYVCEIMQENGFCYDYWEREDGCKMYGPYIMVAADLRIRPKGTIIETSLGTGMVCDTGLFTYMYYYPEEDVFVPSYVTDPANSWERIYDPESYVPLDEDLYPISYQVDIATTW